MMIKRILCFILTICVFGSCITGTGAAVAASPTAENKAFSAAADFLGTLGIFGSNYGMLAETAVKRSEFCGYTAAALKIGDTQGVVGYYKDVNAETKNAAAIEELFKMGALSPADDGRFEPNRNITMNEAIKILLAAIGYQEKALLSGGIYNGYYWLAKNLDLLDDLSYDGNRAISMGEVAVLLKNFLRMNMYEIVGMSVDSEGNVEFGRATGETVLERYYNIAYFEGVVNSNRFTSLLSQENVGEGMVRVGETLLNAGETDISMWLGYTVEVYYNIDREEVVHYDLTDRNAVLEINAQDEPKWENNAISYYNNNGLRTSKQIPADAAIIYNNMAVEVFKSEYVDIDNGVITLIDSDGRNGYETVIIKDYQTVVVNLFNEDFEIISTKNNAGAINLENKEYEIYDEKGKRITEAYVVEWDVLNILNPDGNGIIVIYRTRNHISGKISGVFDDYILLDNGEKYYMLDGFYEENKETLKPGARGVFYLDLMGYIASFRIQDEDNGIGVIINWAESGVVDKSVSVKMLLYNPSDRQKMIYSFDTADKVKVDGKKIESEKIDEYLDSIKNGGKDCIVNYKVNEEGLLSEIDTVVLGDTEHPDYSLVLDYKAEATETANMVYQPTSRIFDGKVAMNSDAVVFYVPADATSDEDYGAVKLNLSNKKGWNPFTTYKIGADKMTADALIFNQKYKNSGGSPGTYDRMAYIDGVWEAWDEETEETCYMIGYYQNNVYYERRVWKEEILTQTYTDATDPDNVVTTTRRLQDGDLALITLNSESEVDGYRLLLDFAKKELPDPVVAGGNYNNATYNAVHRTYIGYVYEIEGDTVALSDTSPAELVEAAKEALKGTYGDDIPASMIKTEVLKSCYKFKIPTNLRIYETDGKIGWNSCSTGDILPYTMYGDECSRMFIHTTYSSSYDAAILD